MSRQKSSPSRSQQPSFPIAGAFGLLVACGVTLIGVVGNLSPEVILLRAVIAGSMAFGIAAGLVTYWKAVSPQREEE